MDTLRLIAIFDTCVNRCVNTIFDEFVSDHGHYILNTITCKKNITMAAFKPIRETMTTLGIFLRNILQSVFTQSEKKKILQSWEKMNIIRNLKSVLQVKNDLKYIDENVRVYKVITCIIDEYEYFTKKLDDHFSIKITK